jgi:hypothetical protein
MDFMALYFGMPIFSSILKISQVEWRSWKRNDPKINNHC